MLYSFGVLPDGLLTFGLATPPGRRASGAMDNASDYGSEDSRFDSWLARAASFSASAGILAVCALLA